MKVLNLSIALGKFTMALMALTFMTPQNAGLVLGAAILAAACGIRDLLTL